MKKINIGGFDAVSLGVRPGSCGMEEVVAIDTAKFRKTLINTPDVYIDPRKMPTKSNVFLLIGTKEQYIELTGSMEEIPWFVSISRKYRCMKSRRKN